MKLRTYIKDKYNRAVIRIKLFFITGIKERETYLIAYALYSEEGRKMLGDAMINPLKT